MNKTLKILATILLFSFACSANFAQSNPDSLFSVKSYHINLDISDFENEIISGSTSIFYEKPKQRLKEIKLNFAGLTSDSVKYEGTKLKFSHAGEYLTIKGKFNNAGNITVFYHGKPQKDASWGGFYFTDSVAFNMGVGMASYPHSYGRVWFPCLDYFNEKAEFTISVSTSKDMKAVCSGVLTEKKQLSDSKIRWTYEMKQDVPPYLVNLAVGKYETIEKMYQGIERNIPIELHFRKHLADKVPGSFVNLKSAAKAFETGYGPYQWPKIGFVGVPFRSGAMEHVCNISYPEYAVNGGKERETLMAHELSHHWFGNLVTCAESEDMWLNEGWASFSEALFKEFTYGKDAYKDYVRNNHLKVLKYTHQYDNGYRAVYGVPPKHTYGSTVYDKGADMVHCLRGYMGDSLFFNTIKHYLQDKKYTAVSTKEFEEYFSVKSGIDLSSFFQNWIYTPGFPHYSAQIIENQKEGENYSVKTRILQQRKERDFIAVSNKIELTFLDNDLNTKTVTAVFDGEEEIRTDHLLFEPTTVLVDMNEKLSDAKVHTAKKITEEGETVFNYTGFSLYVKKLKKPIVIQAAKHFIPPPHIKTAEAEISKESYWTIRGAGKRYKFKGVFYVKSSDFRFTEPVDKLALYYREIESKEWKEIKYDTETISEYEAFFVVDKMPFGDYSVGLKADD